MNKFVLSYLFSIINLNDPGFTHFPMDFIEERAWKLAVAHYKLNIMCIGLYCFLDYMNIHSLALSVVFRTF